MNNCGHFCNGCFYNRLNMFEHGEIMMLIKYHVNICDFVINHVNTQLCTLTSFHLVHDIYLAIVKQVYRQF